MSTSTLSSVSEMSSANFRTEANEVRSSFLTFTFCPVSEKISSAASAAFIAFRQARMTRAPRRANSLAVSLPIPVAKESKMHHEEARCNSHKKGVTQSEKQDLTWHEEYIPMMYPQMSAAPRTLTVPEVTIAPLFFRIESSPEPWLIHLKCGEHTKSIL